MASMSPHRVATLLCLLAALAAASPVAAAPPQGGSPFHEWLLGRGRVGMRVQPLTPELREHFGAPKDLAVLVSAVVSGAPIPISVHVDPELDLSTDVAETVYFVANEAIANVLKHANARVASVHVTKVAANVRVTVHDDGDGGVDASKGTGIAGIRARVHAVDGTLTVTSPVGGPTTLIAEIPRHG